MVCGTWRGMAVFSIDRAVSADPAYSAAFFLVVRRGVELLVVTRLRGRLDRGVAVGLAAGALAFAEATRASSAALVTSTRRERSTL